MFASIGCGPSPLRSQLRPYRCTASKSKDRQQTGKWCTLLTSSQCPVYGISLHDSISACNSNLISHVLALLHFGLAKCTQASVSFLPSFLPLESYSATKVQVNSQCYQSDTTGQWIIPHIFAPLCISLGSPGTKCSLPLVAFRSTPLYHNPPLAGRFPTLCFTIRCPRPNLSQQL